ncbi:hypothetical protein L873DRAFT_923409 [Choiromyces venosus 120613-1]|uniref:Uncharacterized protein n=1 Tax=Choiromyces venosus 120613-1 TaxID=1336337 RepID=A0A3N4JQT4_9PEZI|nr:hypothetical protein L873DRAFT_923409 [Choiromyces venosus 120613-1]
MHYSKPPRSPRAGTVSLNLAPSHTIPSHRQKKNKTKPKTSPLQVTTPTYSYRYRRIPQKKRKERKKNPELSLQHLPSSKATGVCVILEYFSSLPPSKGGRAVRFAHFGEVCKVNYKHMFDEQTNERGGEIIPRVYQNINSGNSFFLPIPSHLPRPYYTVPNFVICTVPKVLTVNDILDLPPLSHLWLFLFFLFFIFRSCRIHSKCGSPKYNLVFFLKGGGGLSFSRNFNYLPMMGPFVRKQRSVKKKKKKKKKSFG